MFACSVLSFLIFFPSFCLCVGTPPRSPTPVSLDPLNFDDYKNAFLDPNQPERSPSPKRLPYVHQQNNVKDVIKPKVEDEKTRSKRGRKRVLTDEQRASAPKERTRRWRAKKKAFDEDVDFVVKQSRKKKAKQRKVLILGNAKKPDKKRKIPKPGNPSSSSM